MAVYPSQISRICHRQVDLLVSDDALRWNHVAGREMVKIANTLQRLGDEFRSDGLLLFEKLHKAGLSEARDLLSDVDNRMKTKSTRQSPPRRRR